MRIHRPARENSDLRSVNRKRDRCIFYSAWVKRVCCVSKISSDCGCQSKEVGVGMEVRLLSVGTRGFFLPASRLVIAASSVAPNEKKTSGTRVGTGRQQYSKRISSFELRFDLKFSIIHPTNGLLKLLLKSNLQ